jgi:serine/threonine-protein kinase
MSGTDGGVVAADRLGMGASGVLASGDRVDAWTIEAALAVGGFGAVYRVSDTATGDVAALKLLHEEHARDADGVLRFERELLAVQRIQHENVVRTRAFGSYSGRPYIVMELLEGEDLDRRIARDGRLSLPAALDLLRPLSAALEAAHERGVIHRDLKASNVFLARQGAGHRVVLLDFGIAKLARHEGLDTSDLTGSRQAIGTPSCMAPEQVRGDEVDARTDVYALGVLTYHLLTGRLAFDDPSPTMVQYLHVHARRPRPSALAPIDPAIDDVVCRAMATLPAHRYPRPSVLIEELERATSPRAPSMPPTSRMIGVHVAVRLPERDDPSLIDEAMDAVQHAREHLVARGYVVAWELATAMLCMRPFADLATPSAEADVTLALWQLLASARLRGLPVHVAMHVDEAPKGTGKGATGALVRPALWDVPARSDAPLLTTAAASALGVSIARVEAELGAYGDAARSIDC